MFEKDYEIRYSDLDRNGNIKVGAIFDVLQDVSVLHADFTGLPQKLMSSSVACFLGGWRVHFNNKLNNKTKITVKTGIMRIGRCEAIRKYEIRQSGECVVSATSAWCTVDVKQNKIIRVPEDFFNVFESIEENDNHLPLVHIRPEKGLREIGSYQIQNRDIDTNNHVNNARSIEIMLEFFPEGYQFTELLVKYRKEIKYGEKITFYGKQNDDNYYLEARNSNGEICVIITALK